MKGYELLVAPETAGPRLRDRRRRMILHRRPPRVDPASADVMAKFFAPVGDADSVFSPPRHCGNDTSSGGYRCPYRYTIGGGASRFVAAITYPPMEPL